MQDGVKKLAKRRRLTKKQRRQRNRWLFGLLLASILFFVGYLTGRRDVDFSQIQGKLDVAIARIEERVDHLNQPQKNSSNKNLEAVEDTSQIHIFDVGQGASTLYLSRDGTSILVDTGRHDDSEKRIISYLDEHIGLGEELDLLIFTHNHSDHIGHGDLVLEYFDVQEVWMNGMDHTSQIYSDLLDALLLSDATYAEPKAGEYFVRGIFKIDVLHPEENSPQKDSNDESIVTRFEFDGLSLMTSGDASIPRENDIVARNHNLRSDLMVLGHHGAGNSTGEEWIQAVRPQMAFYQAGIDNSYGHPHPDTIERLENAGIPIYGTDELGSISIYIDEAGEVTVETER